MQDTARGQKSIATVGLGLGFERKTAGMFMYFGEVKGGRGSEWGQIFEIRRCVRRIVVNRCFQYSLGTRLNSEYTYLLAQRD